MGFSDFLMALLGVSEEEREKLNRMTPKERDRKFQEDMRNYGKEVQKAYEEQQRIVKEKELHVERLVTDPAALDELSDIELERLRITTESEIEEAEEKVRHNEQVIAQTESQPRSGILMALNASSAEQSNSEFKQYIRRRQLLLKMIGVHKGRSKPTAAKPSQSQEDKRAQIKTELKRLETEKTKMVAEASSQDMKVKIANMYDDKQTQLLGELRKLL
jgi:nicotinamide mononucleotide adenylyltransferase